MFIFIKNSKPVLKEDSPEMDEIRKITQLSNANRKKLAKIKRVEIERNPDQ